MIRVSVAVVAALTAFQPATAFAQADAYPLAVQQGLDQRAADCSGLDGGTLTVNDGAVGQIDLTGNGEPDWFIDDLHLDCSSAHSLFCGGTGGCGLTLVVGDTATDYLTKGWDVTNLGPIRTVLMQVHGANCGGTNLVYCVDALVWDPEAATFRSVAPTPE
ncbi:hypothetical protein [Pseudoruegeria sp. SK021]|uniref:hypothetical protein n=1 Tax=Pseudoruegeria sp. SK021 TaxID=1933035 RepID=UPI000A2610E3|nr:hypothetical protein [Pseudoruegeria sp. SK021]OSP56091.1 hypothetical protein BV911_03905 [Pseudoruegeria sp. SK021]